MSVDYSFGLGGGLAAIRFSQPIRLFFLTRGFSFNHSSDSVLRRQIAYVGLWGIFWTGKMYEVIHLSDL